MKDVASAELGWGMGQDGCLLFFIVSLLVLLAFKARVFISLVKKIIGKKEERMKGGKESEVHCASGTQPLSLTALSYPSYTFAGDTLSTIPLKPQSLHLP